MKKEYIKKLMFRYNQFGGVRLLKEYNKMGLIGFTFKELLGCFMKGQPFKTVYPNVLRKVELTLRNKYQPYLYKLKEKYEDEVVAENPNRTIWFSWLQGMDNAPDLVKACYNSVQREMEGMDIKVVTNDNMSDYVDIPDDILAKNRAGIIPDANFSDLLRLEILIKYGGVWSDSTVLCTGYKNNGFQKIKIEEALSADLFMFQYTDNLTKAFQGISTWFIAAHARNKLLMILRDMLYQYWRDYDCVVDYFVCNFFFSMIVEEYPEEIRRMPHGNSMPCLMLGQKLNMNFDEKWYNKLTENVVLHKLNYRVEDDAKNNPNSIYNELMRRYL